MDIAISDETKRLERKHLTLVEELIREASKELGLEDNIELSITFVENQKIQEINRDYRSIDQDGQKLSGRWL